MKKACVLTCLLAMLLSACVATPQPIPTATPEPSKTPLPTATLTPTRTSTPRPTNTPAVTPTTHDDVLQVVKEGGFSFLPPKDYEFKIDGAQVFLSDSTSSIFLSLFGGTSNPENLTQEELIDHFLARVFGEGLFEKQNRHTTTVDSKEGLAYDVIGKSSQLPMNGQVIVVMLSKTRYLFVVGFARTGTYKTLWEEEGQKPFADLLDSIVFSAAGQSQTSNSCKISSDSTYGYAEANAIKVGGGDFGGPPRERAYLDNLLGPNGEAISYYRTGSMDYGDTILDAYEITIGSKTVTLYIDEYSYDEPMAPVGFTCGGAFPLNEP